ncbi:hypothetical protein GHT06_016068 [Daphnia sinensis]|uniref:Uncharacterized protein n=1 Tax=Daphnia sinensis TaxID=1820382 RepID=A0AAD5KRS7_9CRUS|nr:hypothetical protein GHT06_016068 [Daphnia sinensis]
MGGFNDWQKSIEVMCQCRAPKNSYTCMMELTCIDGYTVLRLFFTCEEFGTWPATPTKGFLFKCRCILSECRDVNIRCSPIHQGTSAMVYFEIVGYVLRFSRASVHGILAVFSVTDFIVYLDTLSFDGNEEDTVTGGVTSFVLHESYESGGNGKTSLYWF